MTDDSAGKGRKLGEDSEPIRDSEAFDIRLSKFIRSEAPEVMRHLKEDDERELLEKVTEALREVPEGPARRTVMHKLRRWITAEEKKVKTALEPIQQKIRHLKTASEQWERLIQWANAGLRMQKPIGSMVPDFMTAMAEDRIFAATKEADVPEKQEWINLAESASVFVVEHNWADAFRNAPDTLGGEIRLPDDCCAFEFRINDRHVIVFCTDADGALYSQHAVQVKKGWVLMGLDSGWTEVGDLVSAQIKAIAIALDAEVAITEVKREPHFSNRQRTHLRLPDYSYHIVKLARQQRAEPLERSDEPRHHKRLHFRRGHWRHFETFKTWVRWHLVGSLDLGFVDKEYRL